MPVIGPVVHLSTRLDHWIKRVSPRWLFVSILAINLALIVGVWLLAQLSSTARITIEADTEIVTVELPDHEQGFAWGKLPVDGDSIDGLPSGCTKPQIDLSEQLAGPVTMQARVGTGKGDLLVTLKRLNEKPVGALECEDGRTVGSGPFVRLVLSNTDQRSVTLRFQGHIEAGSAAPEGTTGYLTLNSGRITLNSQNVRSETPLFLGDSVRLYAASGTNQQAIAHGLIRGTPSGPLHLVAHAEAEEARVIHEGQVGETATSVAPSFWTKLQAQTWIVIIGAFILNIVSALRAYRDEIVRS